jgi:hypothetical protein
MNPWNQRRHADDQAEVLLAGRGVATALRHVAPLVDELRTCSDNRPAPPPSIALEHVFAWGLPDKEPSRTRRASRPSGARERMPSWGRSRRVALGGLVAAFLCGSVTLAGAVPSVQDAITDVAHTFGLGQSSAGSPVPQEPASTPPTKHASGRTDATGDVGSKQDAAASSAPSYRSDTRSAPPSGIDLPPAVAPIALPPVTAQDPSPGLPPTNPAPINLPTIDDAPVEPPPPLP